MSVCLVENVVEIQIWGNDMVIMAGAYIVYLYLLHCECAPQEAVEGRTAHSNGWNGIKRMELILFRSSHYHEPVLPNLL